MKRRVRFLKFVDFGILPCFDFLKPVELFLNLTDDILLTVLLPFEFFSHCSHLIAEVVYHHIAHRAFDFKLFLKCQLPDDFSTQALAFGGHCFVVLFKSRVLCLKQWNLCPQFRYLGFKTGIF